jgi:hypothetical protein
MAKKYVKILIAGTEIKLFPKDIRRIHKVKRGERPSVPSYYERIEKKSLIETDTDN